MYILTDWLTNRPVHFLPSITITSVTHASEPHVFFRIIEFLTFDEARKGYCLEDDVMEVLFSRYGSYRLEKELQFLFGSSLRALGIYSHTHTCYHSFTLSLTHSTCYTHFLMCGHSYYELCTLSVLTLSLTDPYSHIPSHSFTHARIHCLSQPRFKLS